MHTVNEHAFSVLLAKTNIKLWGFTHYLCIRTDPELFSKENFGSADMCFYNPPPWTDTPALSSGTGPGQTHQFEGCSPFLHPRNLPLKGDLVDATWSFVRGLNIKLTATLHLATLRRKTYYWRRLPGVQAVHFLLTF